MTASSSPDLVPVARALLSVSDKTGLIDFARFLIEAGVEILSTGGSAAALRQAGLRVREVSDVTGFPEIMDGRVKTLHPAIHGGILARRDSAEHRAAMARHGITGIDLVVSNLYPFAATVARGAGFEDCVENVDIGGPALIRAAAKNHDFVAVVTDPGDYAEVMAAMTRHGGATPLSLRRRLAASAFGRTAAYDAGIGQWFERAIGGGENHLFPALLTLAGERKQVLRYGENPHQQAAFYAALEPGIAPRPGVATARQLQGKELSFNNLADTDAAFELVAEFAGPAVVIVKHANPCGVAVADDLAAAYARALASDGVSAFGGIVALNRPLDQATAQAISKTFFEVIVAPSITPEGKAVLAQKPNLRLLETGAMPDPEAAGLLLRSLGGGYLVQTRDCGRLGSAEIKVAGKRAPSDREMSDLMFAWTVAKHVKSNAIVLAKDGATVGIGAGQMSRVDSARIAAWKAREGGAGNRAQGSVVASDAFFPFADGLLVAAEAGATAAIHPGGSLRDAEVIAAADAAGMALVTTGRRHFRH